MNDSAVVANRYGAHADRAIESLIGRGMRAVVLIHERLLRCKREHDADSQPSAPAGELPMMSAFSTFVSE